MCGCMAMARRAFPDRKLRDPDAERREGRGGVELDYRRRVEERLERHGVASRIGVC